MIPVPRDLPQPPLCIPPPSRFHRKSHGPALPMPSPPLSGHLHSTLPSILPRAVLPPVPSSPAQSPPPRKNSSSAPESRAAPPPHPEVRSRTTASTLPGTTSPFPAPRHRAPAPDGTASTAVHTRY